MTTWFKNTNCSQLEIKRFQSLSDQQEQNSVRIDDSDIISYLVSRIEALPSDGKTLTELGDNTLLTKLTFSCGEEEQIVEVYDDMFKTPSTGFNTGDDAKQEKPIIRDIHYLLQPELGLPLLKSIGLEYTFKEFSITYLGARVNDGKAETASYSYDLFLIQDEQQSQQIKILSGQAPPQPTEVSINQSKATLITYQAADGKRLYPYYFMLLN